MNTMRSRVLGLALMMAGAIALSSGAVVAQGTRTVLDGAVYDSAGLAVSGARVIVRAVAGEEVFVSPPADARGRFELSLPSGESYRIVAAVLPLAGRVELPSAGPFEAHPGALRKDIYLSVSADPGPRHLAREVQGTDRLFLSFVEDPLLPERQRWELQAVGLAYDGIDRREVQLSAAFQPAALPRMELGLRGGAGAWDLAGVEPDPTGLTDLDAWIKWHVHRTQGGKVDVALGGLATFPTGDSDDGLGADALQSKLFLALSRAVPGAVMVMHIGARATGDGELFGQPLEGTISGTAAAGVVVPFSPVASFVVEANYETERFEDLRDDSRVLFGVNWRPHDHGTFRGAIAAGLTDSAPDLQLVLGFALDF